MAKGYINKDEDLVIKGGTFVIGENDEDCIYNNLIAVPGHFKNAPYHGASIRDIHNGNYDQAAKRRVQMALDLDGYSLSDINIEM